MLVRIISAAIGIVFLLLFIIVGGLPLEAVTLLISLIGIYELYKAVSGKIKPVHFAGFLLNIFYFIFVIMSDKTEYFDLIFISMILVIMTVLVLLHKTNTILDGAITVLGFFYVTVMMSLICRLRDFSIIFTWLPFIFAFASDTGAYFIGSAIGKHKLTPELSPHKSVEGAIGGVVTAAVLSSIYAFVCYKYYGLAPEFIWILAIAGAVGSVFGQLGDLAASSIKRQVGIKDYGKIMPGHGGVMDRFDSVLFTMPFVYIIMCIFS